MKGFVMSSILIACPSIGSHRLQRNDESRTLIIDQHMIKFTPIEYRLLLHLLDGNAVSDTSLLQKAAPNSGDAPSNQQNLDKHVDNMRVKLRPCSFSIRRITQYGYILLADLE